jgi:hypothetical protein
MLFAASASPVLLTTVESCAHSAGVMEPSEAAWSKASRQLAQSETDFQRRHRERDRPASRDGPDSGRHRLDGPLLAAFG